MHEFRETQISNTPEAKGEPAAPGAAAGTAEPDAALAVIRAYRRPDRNNPNDMPGYLRARAKLMRTTPNSIAGLRAPLHCAAPSKFGDGIWHRAAIKSSIEAVERLDDEG